MTTPSLSVPSPVTRSGQRNTSCADQACPAGYEQRGQAALPANPVPAARLRPANAPEPGLIPKALVALLPVKLTGIKLPADTRRTRRPLPIIGNERMQFKRAAVSR